MHTLYTILIIFIKTRLRITIVHAYYTATMSGDQSSEVGWSLMKKLCPYLHLDKAISENC